MSFDICKICNKRSLAAGHLDNQELEKLGNSCVDVHFVKGDIIFKEKALSSNIIYVREGLVKVHISGPEREQILKITKGPSFLGIPTTVGEKINRYSATAIAETDVCFIDINTFKELLATNSNFSYEIMMNLCKNEINHFHRCVNQLQKQSHGRVADALLFFGTEIYQAEQFTLPLSRQDFGDLTGNSRENVSRVLADFHHNGLIKLNGKEITLLKKELLTQISKNG